MLKKSLIIFIFLMQSFNLSGLYLADVEENDQSEAKALDKEQESFLCISEHLQKASTYCLDCGSWFLNKASNWLSQNTVTGEPALEKECIERKKSGCYKYLQAGTLVLPLVYALISGTATEEIIGHHLPLYLFYFGFDVSEYIADLVLKNKNKEQIKTIIRKGKMAQGALFLSLAPLRFAEAHFINLLTNEVAAKCSKNISDNETTKNIAYFALKNGIRALLIFADTIRFNFPTTGYSDYPEYCGKAHYLHEKMLSNDEQEIDYALNMAWIYREKNNNTYVFPERDRSGVYIEDSIRGWAEKHRDKKVIFWTDSTFSNPEQIKATENLFEAISQKLSCDNCVVLDDYAALEEYKRNSDIFSAKVSLYFRADFLRLIASLIRVKECKNYCYDIYTDVDILSIDKINLFDEHTMIKLVNNGLIMVEELAVPYGIENSFHMLSNHQPLMITAIENMVKENYNYVREEISWERPIEPQGIFKAIGNIFSEFSYLKGQPKLFFKKKLAKINGVEQEVIFFLAPGKTMEVPPICGDYY